MRLLTIKEILNMENGEVVPSVKGTITDVYDRTTGDSERGEWSVQPCILKDATGTIKIKVWSQPDLRQLKNKPITLESKSGSKGLSGLKVEIGEYKGKETKSLKVSDWVYVGPDEPNQEKEEDDIPFDSPKPKPKTPETGSPSAKQRLAQAANGLVLAFDAALWVAHQVSTRHGVGLAPDAIERVAIHLSIFLQKENLLELLPRNVETRQSTQPEPKPKTNNENDAESYDPEVGF